MREIKRLTVIGAGTMGHGIAQVAAQAGLEAVIHDADANALDRGLRSLAANLDRGVEKGKLDHAERDAVRARVRGERDFKASLAGTDVVVEAVPENLDLKRSIFRDLDAILPPPVILASNTSSLSITELAAAVGEPGRVIGMHFFNPVHIMPLLELVRGKETAEQTVAEAVDLGTRMGKECIVVRDSPGFATSRLGVVLGLEAIRMLEEGVATAEDIDKAMTLGYRHPMGPLRLTDIVGLDVRLAIARHLERTLGSAAFTPPRLLETLVKEGKLGKKTGRGFYTW